MDDFQNLEKRVTELETVIKFMETKQREQNLEKRLKELEFFMRYMRTNNKEQNIESSIWKNLIPKQDKFEESFLKKYSKVTYKEKGLSEKFDELDFADAVKNQKKSDAVQNLHYWLDFQNKMLNNIGLHDYFEDKYWQELRFFVKQFIEYFQNSIVERILKEGRHFEGSGNKPQWKPEKTIQWWDELYPNFSKKKTVVYNEIRKRHNPDEVNKDENGVPNYPSERTIREQLKKFGKI